MVFPRFVGEKRKMNWLQRITRSNSNTEAIMVVAAAVMICGLMGTLITAICVPIF